MNVRVAGAALAAVLSLSAIAGAADAAKGGKATVQKSDYGKLSNDTPIELYTLTNANGVVAKVITFGGIITELQVPDRDGKMADVVLGCDDLKTYVEGHPYFGAIVGRVANRIGKAKFTLDGKDYKLAANNGPNTLHGGKKGFDKVVWEAKPVTVNHGVALRLTYKSPDGEEGFPGTLSVAVTYTLTDKDELKIDYEATSDKATPINLTNHSYFNLAGHNSSSVLDHELTLFADKYTPTDDTLIPTGKIEPVKDTPFDFTRPERIGAHIKEVKSDPVGYDLNYVINHGGKELVQAARVHEPKSGRVMEVSTTEPGIQFYTGNFLDGKQKGKGGAMYKQYGAFCLETQHFPDSVHHDNFPSAILKPGEKFASTTVYHFSVKK
jgi:aldose 1-epimerase